MIPVCLLALMGHAFAEGIHTGIPLETVDGWGSPSFQTSSMGWTTLFEEGLAWVVVTRTEEEAHLWVESLVEKQARRSPNPVEGLADEAFGSPGWFLIAREGNVGVMVQTEHRARDWLQYLLDSIVDDPVTWPEPASLEAMHGGLWVVDAPEAQHIAYRGGRLSSQPSLIFVEPPTQVIVWDSFGRATAQIFDDAGRPAGMAEEAQPTE